MEVSLRFNFVRLFVHALAWKARRDFNSALENPKRAQEKVLREILKLSGTDRLPNLPTYYSDYPLQQSWTSEPVKFFETTSGNSEKKKQIPYTASLLKSFQSLFLIWIDDVLTHQKLKSGKLFISISPKFESLGMNSDLDYLNPFMQKLLNRFLVVPQKDFVAKDGKEFFAQLSERLLACRELESISIWSPSYLISLLDFMKANYKVGSWHSVWPNLKLISCWVDGSSREQAAQLKSIFPWAVIQAKGLLATEAPISVPWTQAMGCVPLWNQVYLEFIDDDGSIHPLYEMKAGKSGEILVSTKGGLLRYKLGDLVECGYRFKNSPVIKFVRRVGDVSDLVGEKLDSTTLMRIFADYSGVNWILIANCDHYVFAADRAINQDDVENKLKEIFHYALARELGQLKPAFSVYVEDLSAQINEYYAARKIKFGDIKAKLLWTDPQILNEFQNLQWHDSSL
tara:strand:+ start:68375 stop:69742 length:1368 start_codon:yes stop_codon:yes gene_type:complete